MILHSANCVGACIGMARASSHTVFRLLSSDESPFTPVYFVLSMAEHTTPKRNFPALLAKNWKRLPGLKSAYGTITMSEPGLTRRSNFYSWITAMYEWTC